MHHKSWEEKKPGLQPNYSATDAEKHNMIIHYTLSVACPTLSNMVFIFCIKLSSFHLVNISMPYAVQSGAICCSLLTFTFGTAMAARTSNTSGTCSFISVITLSQEKFFKSLKIHIFTHFFFTRRSNNTFPL